MRCFRSPIVRIWALRFATASVARRIELLFLLFPTPMASGSLLLSPTVRMKAKDTDAVSIATALRASV